jgi:hypothetical protein
MSTVLDEPATQPTTSPAQRLHASMQAVRVSLSWFGTRKTLTPDQKSRAAETFGAAGEFLSAGKKLLDTRRPSFQAVTSVKTRVLQFWKGLTLPYPQSGIRLIRGDDINVFDVQMTTFGAELDEAVERLDEDYGELRDAAQARLGDLYCEADYPQSLRGLFRIEHDFPSVEPPDYLRQLNPALFRQQCERVAARFDEAVRLAEEAFTDELAKLVSHLTERLSGSDDGKPKTFRDSAVEHLSEFFQRFGQLNVRSNAQLDELVQRARQIVRGVEPQQLRDSQSLRQHVAEELSGVQSVLDGLLVDRPRRRIIRSPK